MYRLMKCERTANDLLASSARSFYLQIQVSKFHKFSDALAACRRANERIGSRHYVLNQSGKEYHKSAWID